MNHDTADQINSIAHHGASANLTRSEMRAQFNSIADLTSPIKSRLEVDFFQFSPSIVNAKTHESNARHRAVLTAFVAALNDGWQVAYETLDTEGRYIARVQRTVEAIPETEGKGE